MTDRCGLCETRSNRKLSRWRFRLLLQKVDELSSGTRRLLSASLNDSQRANQRATG